MTRGNHHRERASVNPDSCLRAIVVAALSAGVVVASPLQAQPRPQLEFVRAIGVAGGSQDLEFGDISGVAVSSRGEILVFDRINLRLSVFSADGQLLDMVGREGRGPQEFGGVANPVIHHDTIYVPDARNGRVARWKLSGGRLSYVDQSRITYATAAKVCSLPGAMYYLVYANGGLIQKADFRSKTVTAFGAPFHQAPGLNRTFMSGEIACDNRAEAVYVASNMSVLRRYDGKTGRLQWQTSIPGIVAPTVEVDRRTGLPQYRRRKGTSSLSLVSVVAAPNGQILVQAGDPPVGARPGWGRTLVVAVKTAAFDARTGRLIEIRSDLPRIDYSFRDHAYAWPADPFPQVRIYRWR